MGASTVVVIVAEIGIPALWSRTIRS